MPKLITNFTSGWKSTHWRWALIIAVLSDALGFAVVLFPPEQWALDAETAIALLIVLGYR